MISDEAEARARAILACKGRLPLAAVMLPITLTSAANARDSHWGQRRERVKSQRQGTRLKFMPTARALLRAAELAAWPVVVRLVRVAPRALDDDNLANALKAVRDGVADALKVNDRDPRVRFVTDQERGSKPAVLIEVYRP